jgi:hypothetical protein
LDEAREMAKEALTSHVEFMIADGEVIPEPSTLEVIMSDPENKEAVAAIVEISHPSATRRINVTIREDMLKKIDSYAKHHGMTRSRLFAIAALHEIEKSA